MESHEMKHIQTNLPELIKSTLCTISLLARLKKLDVLSLSDVEEIEYKALTPQEKSNKLYEILQTRTKGYGKLITALYAEQQTGAVRILEATIPTEQRLSKNVPSLSYDELKQRLESLKLPDDCLEITLRHLNSESDLPVGEPILHELVFCGADQETIQNCIIRGADPYCFDCDGQNLIHYAAKGGNYQVIRYLVSLRLDINKKDANGTTPLLSSALGTKNILETVFELLESGADIHAQDNYGHNFFLLACREGWTDDQLTRILKWNINPKLKNKRGQSALHLAALGGNFRIIGFLLNLGLDLEEKETSGRTPLLMIAQLQSKPLYSSLSAFLKYNAYIGAVDNYGNNLFLLATWQGRTAEELEHLIATGVDYRITNNAKQTALHLAAKGGNYKVLPYLKSIGFDINSKDRQGNIPLFLCSFASNFSWEKVKELLPEAADINYVNSSGNNLFLLASQNNKSVYELSELVKLGVNAKIENKNKQTAFHFAAAGGNFEVYTFLKSIGLDINKRDNQGNTPLLCCSFAGKNFLEAVRKLVKEGADKNVVNNNGNNLFLLAAQNNQSVTELAEIVKLGVDTKQVNFDQRSAFHLVAESGYFEVISYLKNIIGLSINGKDRFGNTPLLRSSLASKNFLETVGTLQKEGANINDLNNNGANLFLLACLNNKSLAELLELAKLGVNANIQNRDEQTALHFAAEGGNFGLISHLKSTDFNINKKDRFGNTPLLRCTFCSENFLETAGELVRAGADVNAVNYNGNNLFLLATWNGKSVAELSEIANLGVDTKLRNNDKQTALHMAAKGGNFKVISHLKSIGLLVNKRDKFGCTPLLRCSSASKNFLETVRELVNKGAHVHAKNSNGDNLYYLASRNNKSATELSELVKFGVNPKSNNCNIV